MRSLPSTTRRLALACSLALCSSTALAGPSEAEKDRAGALMDEGDAHLAAGRFDAAVDAYKKADAIMGVPTTRGAVAASLAKAGRLQEAREQALSTAKLAPAKNEPKVFKAARAAAQELATSLETRIPTLRIRVHGPAQATPCTVQIGPRELSCREAEVPFALDPGTLRLVVKAPGFAEHAQSVALAERERRELLVELSAETPSSPSSPRAAQGGSSTSPFVYVGLTVAAVGAAVGGVTGALTFSKSGKLEDECGGKVCPADRSSDLDEIKRLGTVADVSFVVAGGGLAVAAIAWLASGSSSNTAASTASRSARLTPSIGPGSFSLSGRF